MSKIKIVAAAVILVAVVGAAAGVGWYSTRPKQVTTKKKPETVAVTRGDVQLSVSAPGRLEAARRASLGFGAQGTLAKVQAEAGEAVAKGETLATLDSGPLQARLKEARDRLAAAKSEYRLKLQTAQLDIDAARASLSAAEGTSGADTNALRLALKRAEMQLRSVKSQGVDASAKQMVKEASDALDGSTIEAPFAGVVVEVRATAGDAMQPGQTVVVVADVDTLEIRSTVTEQDYPLLKVGQRAEVFFDAAPDVAPRAKISRIVPQRVADGERTLFPVYVTVADMPEGLAIGMTADASIVVDERTDVLTLPREVVKTGGNGRALVHVWVNGRTEQRTVEVGLRGDSGAEILSGLREGDAVVAE